MLAALLLATTLIWTDSLDVALRRAQSEKKLVLVYLRSTEDRKNLKSDENLDRAAANENVAYLMESFVLARTSVPGPLLGGQPAPSLIVVDPRGLRVTTFAVGSEKEIAMSLAALRDRTPELV